MKRFSTLLLFIVMVCCFVANSHAAEGLKDGCALGKDENRRVMLDKYVAGAAAFEAGNHSKAFALLKPVAEAGNPNAQYLVAIMYDFGRGVGVNHEVANEWYLKAAQQGNDDAQYNLGISYQTGEGIAKDIKMSICWVAKAAANGDNDAMDTLKDYARRYPDAQYALAQIFRNGVKLHNNDKLYPHEKDNTEIKPNMDAYKIWLQKAADGGHAIAKEEIKNLP